MAVALVKSAKGVSALATTTASFASATTSGNLIVLGFAADDYNGSPGAGWTQSTGMEQQTFHGSYLWWRISTGETNFQYEIGSASPSAWVIAEFSGVDGTPYDTSNGQFEQSGGALGYTTPTITPATGDRLLVAFFGASHTDDLSAITWGSWTNSFTAIDSIGTSAGSTKDLAGLGYRLVTGNGSTGFSTGATPSASQITTSRSGLIIAFEAATASTQALTGKVTAAAALKSSASFVGGVALSAVTALAAKLRLGVAAGALQLPSSTTSLRLTAKGGLNTQSTPTSSPVLISATSTAFNTTTTPKTASGITVQNGDVLIAHAMMESSPGDNISIATTSGSTVAWTLLVDAPGVTDHNRSYLRTWWTTASAPGTVSVEFTKSGGPSVGFGGTVKVYRNSTGVGAVATANNGTGSGAPSVSLTTTKDLSALDFASADWTAASGTATFTSTAGTPSTDLDVLATGAYRVYSSHVDAGSAGSKTIGMSAPSAQRYMAAAIEVLGAGSVNALTARARISSRGGSTFSGATVVAGSAAVSTTGRSAFSGRVGLAGRTNTAIAARIAQSVALYFQTRFFPAMRGTLTTIVSLGASAGSAVMTAARGDVTARTAVTGKTATEASAGSSVAGATQLSGQAAITSRAGSTFSGAVILAIQTRFFPALRGALNVAAVPTGVALAATAAAIGRARAAVAGRTALQGVVTGSSRATGGLSALTALAGRAASKATGAASVAVRAALAAAATVRATLIGSMVGRAALFGRAAVATAARFGLPGSIVELFARATSTAKITAGMVSRTSLAAKTALTVKAAAIPPIMAAFMSALAGVAVKARTGATAVTTILVTSSAAVALSARSTFSGAVGLAARAKTVTVARIGGGFTPLLVRAVVRASAKALLFVLAPVITPPVNARPSRLSRINASLLKAFGEEFDIKPMTPAVDVNSRSQTDISRATILDISGIWDGPMTSRTPHARGALQDDNAHNWNASYPSANFDDTLVAGVRKGDVLTRKLDGAVYEVVRVVPNGFGRTTLQLSKRKRS